MRKMLSVLAAMGVACATIFAGGAIASANSAEKPERETVEVTWIMPEGASDKSPQWPQTYSPSGEIPCGRWAQIDTYYADEADRFTEDGILEKGEDSSSDTQKGALKWRFAQGAECVEPTVVTPVAPTVVQAADCETEGYVTIPQTKGVRYEFYAVPGENQSGKRYEGPVQETVKVIVEEGYVLAEGAQTEFPFDVKPFAGDCVEPTVVTPVAPTVVQAADCETEGYVTIPQTKGVRYEFYAVPGENQSGKRYEGPVQETVKVIVEEGYVLAEGAQTEFPFDVKPFGSECLEPTKVVAPTIIEEKKCDTNSTVTIPDTAGVVFSMGGQTVKPGILKAPIDGTLTAHPAAGYSLADDARTEWAINLAAAKPCAQTMPVKTPSKSDPSLPELAYTGANPALMGAGVALMLALGAGLTLAGRGLRWGRRG